MDLIEAVIHNNRDEVEKILSTGADPNFCLDEARVTPLHFAAQHNSVDVIDLLIAAGADIYARTIPEEQTPLDVAKLFQHVETIALLEEYTGKIPF